MRPRNWFRAVGAWRFVERRKIKCVYRLGLAGAAVPTLYCATGTGNQAVRGTGVQSDAWAGYAGALLPTRRGDALRIGLLTVAYAAVSTASFFWLAAPGTNASVWPAAGVALAALAVGGPGLWPGVALGHLLAIGLAGRLPGASDIILAGGATLAAALPALAHRRLRLDPSLASLPAMLWLCLSGAFGATVWVLAGLAAQAAAGASLPAFGAVAQVWWFGHLAGVLPVTAAALSWRPHGGQTVSPMQALHLAVSVATSAAVAYAIFLWPDRQAMRSWFIFPALVWPALVFSLRGASLALLAVAGVAFAAALQGVGPLATAAGASSYTAYTQQFVAIVSMTVLILAAVADERRGRQQLEASERRLRGETEALDILNRTGAAIAAELDLDAAVRLVTDAGVSLSGAQFAAFFYNVVDEAGESLTLYALSGAPREAFDRFGQPRNTAVFAPTFTGEALVRVDDITQDPRYGDNPPHRGTPTGHLPVRSYMATPVKSRSGEVLGGLLFGHADAGVFDARAERLVVGLAAQAAIAIDNARLYQAAQREIEQRRRAEQHQRLLMNELNHRVKNTLATVQSMGSQTMRDGRSLAEAKEAFVARLIALSAAHNLLMAERWDSADLEDLVRMAVAPFDGAPGSRIAVSGPDVRLPVSQALGLAMALQELGSNASRYGALSDGGGGVRIAWTIEADATIQFVWEEHDGPPVEPPLRRGFGSRLIQEGLPRELQAEVDMDYRPEGLRYQLRFRLDRVQVSDDPASDFEDSAPPEK